MPLKNFIDKSRAQVLRERDAYAMTLFRNHESRARVRALVRERYGVAQRNDRLAQLRAEALPIRIGGSKRVRASERDANIVHELRRQGVGVRSTARRVRVGPSVVEALERRPPREIRGTRTSPGGVSLNRRTARKELYAPRRAGDALNRFVYTVTYARDKDARPIVIRFARETPLSRAGVLEVAQGNTAEAVDRAEREGRPDESEDVFKDLEREGKLGSPQTGALEAYVAQLRAARPGAASLDMRAERYRIVDFAERIVVQ